jgi:hypothetical protein
VSLYLIPQIRPCVTNSRTKLDKLAQQFSKVEVVDFSLAFEQVAIDSCIHVCDPVYSLYQSVIRITSLWGKTLLELEELRTAQRTCGFASLEMILETDDTVNVAAGGADSWFNLVGVRECNAVIVVTGITATISCISRGPCFLGTGFGEGP